MSDIGIFQILDKVGRGCGSWCDGVDLYMRLRDIWKGDCGETVVHSLHEGHFTLAIFIKCPSPDLQCFSGQLIWI